MYNTIRLLFLNAIMNIINLYFIYILYLNYLLNDYSKLCDKSRKN